MIDDREQHPAGPGEVVPGSLGIDLATRVDDLQRRLDVLIARLDPDIPANIAAIAARRIEAELKALLLSDQELWDLFVRLRDAHSTRLSIVLPATAQELARRRSVSAHRRIAETRARSHVRQRWPSGRTCGPRPIASIAGPSKLDLASTEVIASADRGSTNLD
jgi:hypothetical protein